MPAESEDFPTQGGTTPEFIPPLPAPVPKEIWRPRDLLLFVAFIPFALVASKFGLLMAFVVARPFLRSRMSAEAVQLDIAFLLTQQGVFYVLILGFLFLLARLQHQQPFWKSLGWKKLTPNQLAGYLFGGGGLAVAVSVALVLRPDTQSFPLEKFFDSQSASIAIGAFAVSIAPVIEEVVFRGLLFAILERSVGCSFAVVMTGLLFGGLHIPEYWHAWNHLAMIFVVGLVFSLARGVTGSLTPSILLHIGYNTVIMTGLFFSTQHFRNVTGFLWQ
jgi:hypothetical protein